MSKCDEDRDPLEWATWPKDWERPAVRQGQPVTPSHGGQPVDVEDPRGGMVLVAVGAIAIVIVSLGLVFLFVHWMLGW